MVKDDVTAVVRSDIRDGSSSDAVWVDLRNKKSIITLLGIDYRRKNSQQE